MINKNIHIVHLPELIVIGTSAGGIRAITELLKPLPKNFCLPIVIVLHRLKNASSNLEEVLQHKCAIKIKEADEKEVIEPSTVYLAPANYHLLIEKNKTFSLDYSELVNWSRPSIDITFESAAAIYQKNLLGILLTGANTDGAIGMKAIMDNGGYTIAQNPEAAEVRSMPESAVKNGAAKSVMNLQDIATSLIKLHHKSLEYYKSNR